MEKAEEKAAGGGDRDIKKPDSWEEFDEEYMRRSKNIKIMENRLAAAYNNLRIWSMETTGRLRKEIGPRKNGIKR